MTDLLRESPGLLMWGCLVLGPLLVAGLAVWRRRG